MKVLSLIIGLWLSQTAALLCGPPSVKQSAIGKRLLLRRTSVRLCSNSGMSDEAEEGTDAPLEDASQNSGMSDEAEEGTDAPLEGASMPSPMPSPGVVPLDYDMSDLARPDLPLEKLFGGGEEKKKSKVQDSGSGVRGVPALKSAPKSLAERLREAEENNNNRPREGGWVEDPSRPTGYGIPDENDNEIEML